MVLGLVSQVSNRRDLETVLLFFLYGLLQLTGLIYYFENTTMHHSWSSVLNRKHAGIHVI